MIKIIGTIIPDPKLGNKVVYFKEGDNSKRKRKNRKIKIGAVDNSR